MNLLLVEFNPIPGYDSQKKPPYKFSYIAESGIVDNFQLNEL